MPRFAVASVMRLIVLLATSVGAQWLNSPTPYQLTSGAERKRRASNDWFSHNA
jgi:hypothetical protein